MEHIKCFSDAILGSAQGASPATHAENPTILPRPISGLKSLAIDPGGHLIRTHQRQSLSGSVAITLARNTLKRRRVKKRHHARKASDKNGSIRIRIHLPDPARRGRDGRSSGCSTNLSSDRRAKPPLRWQEAKQGSAPGTE